MPCHLISDIYHLRKWPADAHIPSLLLRWVAGEKQLRLTSKVLDFSRDPFTTLFAFEAFTQAHFSRVTDNEHNRRII